MRRLIISGLFLLCLSTPAFAYDNYEDIYGYFKGGLHHWKAGEASAEGLKMAFGQQLTPFAGVEAHLAMGGEDKEAGLRLERLFGMYGKFNLPLGYFNPYAKLGFTSAVLKEAETSNSEFEMGLGVGVELSITDNLFFDFEYMSYLDTAEIELNGFTLSLGYKLK